MVQTSWFIRKHADKEDYIDALYEKNPSFFSLEIHHGGVFIKTPERRYVDGKISYVDCVDGDEFSVIEATWNGGTKFQVMGPWMDQCVVDIVERTCSCRKWELTGMPCKHAVCAFYNMSNNRMQVQLPETYVHPVYWLDTWKKMYSYTIGPTKGRSYWPRSNCAIGILPPKHKVSIGRPKKKRRRSQIEIQLVKEGKLTRAAALTRCGNCKQDGHNKRTCPKVPTKEAGSSSRAAGGSRGAGSKGGGSKIGKKKTSTK